tara:strand:- start:2673 stop:2852 length:180 start_codon:yes stop_codon:yes gene_type:complete
MAKQLKNIYWKEAMTLDLTIERVGAAFVALKGTERHRVFWHGNESKQATKWLDWISGGA